MDNLPPFYVGQKVVALATSQERCGLRVVKGNIYTVANQTYCCNKWHIGLSELVFPDDGKVCLMCHKNNGSRNAGALASKLSPLLENFQSISLSKILEKETELIGVN